MPNLPVRRALLPLCAFPGYNQEDSIILNQGAIDRGLFSSTFYRSIKESEVTHGADEERFNADQEGVLGKRKADYSKLDENGIIPIGAVVEKDTVVLGKTIDYTVVNKCENGDEYVSKRTKRDRSVVPKSEETSRVHNITISATKDGHKYVSIKTAASRTPEIGDKFCYTPDHELLTPTGWTPICAVQKGDIVAILDPVTQTMLYEPTQDTQQYQVNEELYEIQSDAVDLKVTMNHRLLVAETNTLSLIPAHQAYGRGSTSCKSCTQWTPGGPAKSTRSPVWYFSVYF